MCAIKQVIPRPEGQAEAGGGFMAKYDVSRLREETILEFYGEFEQENTDGEIY